MAISQDIDKKYYNELCTNYDCEERLKIIELKGERIAILAERDRLYKELEGFKTALSLANSLTQESSAKESPELKQVRGEVIKLINSNAEKEAIMQSRAVLGGQFSEQLAPFLPNFDNLPTECRFIGKPIDFIVFKGMDEKKINEVVFVEVKSGNARTSPVEKSLKDTIENKRVRWEEYRIPDELTKKKDIVNDIKKL